ncbi:MAG TPA: sulfotransferase [Mycobacteriales bacterium]|nr:sulfotransferase [Mycobacteriales bacterium]
MSAAHPLRPVFILGGDRATHLLREALASRAGWSAPPPMDLLSRMSRLLWGHQIGGGIAGVSSLVDGPHLMAALRRVADQLVAPATTHGSAYSVDVIANAELLGPYLRGVWPDALVVAIGEPERGSGTAAAEPDLWLHADDVVRDPDAAADLAAAAASQAVIDLPGPAEPGELVFSPQRSPLHERVIVVLGAARSGTTWLHRLLSAHPRIAGTETGETWLFPDVAPLWADDVRATAGDDLTLTSLRAFCDDLLSGLLRRADGPVDYVCEKTPTTVWQLPFVARLYPDAYFVHVVRDGRDAAMSLALTRGGGAGLAGAAQEWVDAVGAIRAVAPELDQLREVRYEDLLADPESVVAGVWSWIGVPPSVEARAALEGRAGERVTPLPASGEIGTGKWRSLPDGERRVVESVTADLLRELGYPVGPS